MRREDFPIDNNLLKEYIGNNRDLWGDVGKSKRYILINMSMVRMQIPWVLPKILFAKGIQEATGAIPVVLTWNENEELSRFFESFSIEHIAINKMCKRNVWAFIKASAKTAWFELTKGSGKDLKVMRYKNMNIGLNLYEDILRTSSLSTLKTCRNKIAIKKIFHLLWSMYSIESYMKRYKTAYAITDDMAYHEGLFIKLFKNQGVKVIACSNVSYGDVELHDNGEVKRHNWVDSKVVSDYVSSLSDDAINWTESYLTDRFQGKNGRDIDKQAFTGKKVLSRDELIDQFGLDASKKTIVIMAHTFTDAVFNYGTYFFRDYYDWTEKTLEIAASVSDVNWVLKPHPTRSSYNESADSIEDMFKKHKTENMFFLSDDISSESIKNIADVLITVGGNAGAEYACFGIPPIVVGRPYYSGQGYTIEPKSYDEYKQLLLNVSDIELLSEEQIDIAKKVFYYKNNRKSSDKMFTDEFADGLNGKYSEMRNAMPLAYFKDNNGTKEYNNRALEYVMDYMKTHDIKESQYYIAGTNIDLLY